MTEPQRPTGEAIFFVVERSPSGETAGIYYERLPDRLTRKIPKLPDGKPAEPGLQIYALRLDKLPDCDHWLGQRIGRLLEVYRALRDQGKLPPSNLAAPPQKGADRGGRLFGEHWQPPARTWKDQPADPYPEPGTLQPRPEASAFIGTGSYIGLNREG